MMGLEFETAGSGVEDEESYIDMRDLEGSLCRLAGAKAEDASRKNPGALVIGADTVVVCGAEALGKPKDAVDAARMLRELSGASHTVITAVALLCAETAFRMSKAARSDVFFRELGEEDIQYYLSFPEYKDKAGSYAVQGRGMCFIDKIEVCYDHVMGLPVTATLDLLKEFVRKDCTDV
jgi:septum formation protein